MTDTHQKSPSEPPEHADPREGDESGGPVPGAIAFPSHLAGSGMLDRLVETAPPGANGLIYTPWIYGERAPIEDQTIRAGLHHLSLEHTRADVVRALYEGIALNTRWILRPVERFLGNVIEQDIISRKRKNMSDSIAHLPGTDDANRLDIHGPTLIMMLRRHGGYAAMAKGASNLCAAVPL